MQTAKTRNSTTETPPPQRTSPSKVKAARQLKISGPDSDVGGGGGGGGVASPNQASKKPKEGSPRIIDRKSPRTPTTLVAAEKKRLTKVSELESQLSQIQEELKKAKDKLNSSESTKKQAQQEAEDAKKQLEDLSTAEEARVQELRKISQERDQTWQSELEAIQKQHSMDSEALSSSLNEIQKLKLQLERVSESEASHARHAESAHADIQNLRHELTETLALVEKLKTQITNLNESEDQALELLNRTQMQLEIAKSTEETLRSENDQTVESLKALLLEFDQSKARVNSLEELVTKLQADDIPKVEDDKDTNQLKNEFNEATTELNQLRTALDVAERRYQEEYIQSTLQIRSAYELVEKMKSESSMREAEFEEKLKKGKTEVEEENIEKNSISERESNMERELKKLGIDMEDLKASLMDKETELQIIMEENETLKREIDGNKSNNEAIALAEAAKAAERDGLMIKVGSLAEEADKSNRKAARTFEQLEATQVANLELEAELRKLKVQSDQWRKAAEAAAAMISSTGNNGRFVERTGSLNSNYNNNSNSIGGGKKMIGSPNYEDEMEDESPKKKNGNMLKKIGVLLKKGSIK